MKTSLPPQYCIQFADATKVMGVVITFCPGLRPKASTQRCKAAVPLDTAIENLEFTYFEKAFQSEKFEAHDENQI